MEGAELGILLALGLEDGARLGFMLGITDIEGAPDGL